MLAGDEAFNFKDEKAVGLMEMDTSNPLFAITDLSNIKYL